MLGPYDNWVMSESDVPTPLRLLGDIYKTFCERISPLAWKKNRAQAKNQTGSNSTITEYWLNIVSPFGKHR